MKVKLSKPDALLPDDERLVGRHLARFFWASVGTGGQAGLQLLVLLVLAHLLAPSEFGLLTAALAVIGVGTIFSQCGIGPAVVQRLELSPARLRTAFTLSWFLGALLAALIWLLAPVLAHLLRLDELTGVLRALAFVPPLQGLGLVAEALLQRERRFRRLALLDVSSVTLGQGLVGIGLAGLGWGVWALVAASLTQTACRTLLLLLLQPHPKRPLLERRALTEFLRFGGGFTAAAVGNYLAGQGDNLVVGRWLGAAALGIYGRAYQLMAGPAILLGEALDRVLFPAMAQVQDQPGQLALTYRRCIALVALVVTPASVLAMVLAPELVQVLLGPDWSPVTVPLQILLAGMLFRCSYKISDALARATGAVYRRAWRQGIYALAVTGAAWVGQFWGVPGVAVGVLASLAVNFLLMAQVSLSLTAMTWRDFGAAQVPGLVLAALVGGEGWAVAMVLRAWAVSPPGTIGLCLAAVLSSAWLVRWLPTPFLGPDGRWLLDLLVAWWAQSSQAVAYSPEVVE